MMKKPNGLTVLPPQQMARQRHWLGILAPYQAAANSLSIATEEDYRKADSAFLAVQTMASTWDQEMEELLEPARKLKQGLDNLKRSVAAPLDLIVMTIRDKMTDYKRAEAKRIREAEEAHQRELARLEAEKRKKDQAVESATTQKMRERLVAARQAVEVIADNLAYQGSGVKPIVAEASITKTVKVCQVNNLEAFIQGVSRGQIPEWCIAVVQARLNEEFKARPEIVKSWPGVEVFDDIRVVKRSWDR